MRNVSKTYGATQALRDITLSIEEGQFVSVIGPSGAGKSTLLRCVNRLVDATQGVIILDGQDITKVRGRELRRVRTKTGMIFQNYNLVNRLSVIENVLHGRLGHKSTLAGAAGWYTEREKERAFSILERLGLHDQAYKRADELSGGQKQRVGIARALIKEPRLILCDEPIASLDPSSARVIMDYLQDINRTMKITCILNLHQVEVAMKYSERIIGITAGAVIFDGPPEALHKDMIHRIYQSREGELILDGMEESA
jgi:phosphonate transport system ATP-binding protein